jgi:Tfp pilus assembly PilM family ATPase
VTSTGIHLPPSHTVIGVEVADRWIIASQVHGTGSRTRAQLVTGLRLPRREAGPVTRDEAGMLMASLRRAGFFGQRLVLSAPDASLLLALLELPPRTSKAPIEQLARVEVARIHRCEPQSFELATWDLPATDRTKGATHAIAVALPLSAGDAATAGFDGTGAEIVALEPRSCALARAACAASSPAPGLIGIVDVSWNAVSVVLVHQTADDSSIVYERKFSESTFGQCVQAVHQHLDISAHAAEAALRASDEDMRDPLMLDLLRNVRRFQSDLLDKLVPEVQRSFVYATQRYPTLPLTSIWLTGEGATLRGLRPRLATALTMEVDILTPARITDCDERSAVARDASLVVSLGLCAHAPHLEAQRSAA